LTENTETAGPFEHLVSMATFYFNVYNNETPIDEIGVDLVDLGEAQEEARTAAADIIREEFQAGGSIATTGSRSRTHDGVSCTRCALANWWSIDARRG